MAHGNIRNLFVPTDKAAGIFIFLLHIETNLKVGNKNREPLQYNVLILSSVLEIKKDNWNMSVRLTLTYLFRIHKLFFFVHCL